MLDVAVVIPGIMGSCLEYRGTHTEIWTEEFGGNYKRLINNPALIEYDGKAADATRLLEFVRYPVVPFWRTHLLTRMLDYLKTHRDFQHPFGVMKFAYDWRESIAASAAKLGAA